MFRRHSRQRPLLAFSAKPLQSPMTRFRGKGTRSMLTATEFALQERKRVRDLHPIPLFSRTRMRVSPFGSVAHLPQKPEFHIQFPDKPAFRLSEPIIIPLPTNVHDLRGIVGRKCLPPAARSPTSPTEIASNTYKYTTIGSNTQKSP